MAKVKVTYVATMVETIDWPDDEMDNFNYENLCVNLDPEKAASCSPDVEIETVLVNGKSHDF